MKRIYHINSNLIVDSFLAYFYNHDGYCVKVKVIKIPYPEEFEINGKIYQLDKKYDGFSVVEDFGTIVKTVQHRPVLVFKEKVPSKPRRSG